MKNFVIPPTSALHLSELGNAGFFILGQLYIKDEKYRNYVQERVRRGSFTILDSGIGDHDPIDQDVLIDLAVEIKPTEVIPLDTLFNKQATLDNLEDFLSKTSRHGLLHTTSILAVPQGQNVAEWLECYEHMLKHPFVRTIGISKLSTVQAWGGGFNSDQGIKEARVRAITYLNAVKQLTKPLHFLGMGDPTEFGSYAELDLGTNLDLREQIFRSTDSCNSIWSAMNDLDWSRHDFERIQTPKDYFDREVTVEEQALAIRNAMWFHQYLKRVFKR